jgi:hypothetical protein
MWICPAQGAKVTLTISVLALAPCAAWQQIGLFLFTILLLTMWICPAQGSKASATTSILFPKVTVILTMSVLALAPCAAWQQIGLFVFTILDLTMWICPAQGAKASTTTSILFPKATVTLTVSELALAP